MSFNPPTKTLTYLLIMLSVVEKRHCLAEEQSEPGLHKSDIFSSNENDEVHVTHHANPRPFVNDNAFAE